MIDLACGKQKYTLPSIKLFDSTKTTSGEAESSIVRLSDVVLSPEFQNSPSPLTFAIGKDEVGNILIGDLEKEVHLLVAGTTGTGKSSFIHSFITSLLFKCSPNEVHFILIDPTGIELCAYDGLPHLLFPVITDSSRSLAALHKCENEIAYRFAIFKDAAVSNIHKYNEKALLFAKQGVNQLPQIVVIIDGLINIMSGNEKKDIEELIRSITQAGRAAGIHLVIGTPRPSSRVLAGILKANIPSRISFEVTSSLESRINMGNKGAEHLSQPGEMLYLPVGYRNPIHGQSAYTEDTIRDTVLNFIKSDNAYPQ